jgi:hypothetical protein
MVIAEVDNGVEFDCVDVHSVGKQGVGLAEPVLWGGDLLAGISTIGVGYFEAARCFGDFDGLAGDSAVAGSWFSWFSLLVKGLFGPSSGTAISSTSWIERFRGPIDGDGGMELGGSGERLIMVSVGVEEGTVGVQIIGSELAQIGKQARQSG